MSISAQTAAGYCSAEKSEYSAQLRCSSFFSNCRTTQDVKPRASPFRFFDRFDRGRERDMDEDATDNRQKSSAGMTLRDVEVSIGILLLL